jgi:hypothetical protein
MLHSFPTHIWLGSKSMHANMLLAVLDRTAKLYCVLHAACQGFPLWRSFRQFFSLSHPRHLASCCVTIMKFWEVLNRYQRGGKARNEIFVFALRATSYRNFWKQRLLKWVVRSVENELFLWLLLWQRRVLLFQRTLQRSHRAFPQVRSRTMRHFLVTCWIFTKNNYT